MNASKSLSRPFPNVIYVLVMCVFFIFSTLLYEPKGLCELFHIGESKVRISNLYYFNVTILSAIILLTLSITRLLLCLVRKSVSVTKTGYFSVCAAELVLIAAFSALYISLISASSESYFVFLMRCLAKMAPIMVIPQIIHSLYYQLHDSRSADEIEQGARIKFYDSRHLLKFITYASSVLFIESNENYIVIHYREGDVEKKYQIRNTMKSVEALSEKAGFARVHRRFIVNPAHIKSVRKDEGGLYFADLGPDVSMEVPVSKRCYDNITALL